MKQLKKKTLLWAVPWMNVSLSTELFGCPSFSCSVDPRCLQQADIACGLFYHIITAGISVEFFKYVFSPTFPPSTPPQSMWCLVSLLQIDRKICIFGFEGISPFKYILNKSTFYFLKQHLSRDSAQRMEMLLYPVTFPHCHLPSQKHLMNGSVLSSIICDWPWSVLWLAN